MNDFSFTEQMSAVQTHLPLDTNADNLQALLALGEMLKQSGYRFVTVTPCTHQIVNARIGNEWALSLRDVFGWSRSFKNSLVDSPVTEDMQNLMQRAGILQAVHGGWKSSLRVSTLDDELYFHSSYPTEASNSVFFGPDTYRFARLLNEHLPKLATPVKRVVDIGCGAGPGAMTIAKHFPQAEVTGVDINDAALHLSKVNIHLAGLNNVTTCNSNLLNQLSGQFDLIVSNPPYLNDVDLRDYRHGGGAFGGELTLAIVDEALHRLQAGGTLLLYSGAAVIDGVDPMYQQLEKMLNHIECVWTYEEIDPDVFGEELNQNAYAQCDRIAAVCLKVCMP